MKKRAFTLVELMVAVGLMGMMIAFTSVIFRFGIDAHRISSAKAEIMQKVRVITEQLNSDERHYSWLLPSTLMYPCPTDAQFLVAASHQYQAS